MDIEAGSIVRLYETSWNGMELKGWAVSMERTGMEWNGM